MQAHRKSDELVFANDSQPESILNDSAVAEQQIQLDGNWTGGAGSLAQDPALKLMHQLEVNHNGPRVAMDTRLLFWNSAFHNKGVRDLSSSVAGATGDFLARFALPYQRMVPRGGYDAVARAATIRPRLRTGAAILSGGATIAVTSRVRPTFIAARSAPAGGFRDPAWREEHIPCGVASVSANTRKIEFGQDMVLPYLVLIALDADGDVAGLTDRTFRTDGLVQRLTIEKHGRGGEVLRLIDDITWGALRARTAELGQFSNDDQASAIGVIVVPLVDPREKDGLLRMQAGTHLSIIADTASPVERGYTDVVPAAGDELLTGVFAFHAVEKETPRNAATLAETSTRAAVASQRII